MDWLQYAGLGAGVAVMGAYAAMVKGASRRVLDIANAVCGVPIVASEVAVGAWAAVFLSGSWMILGIVGLLTHRDENLEGLPGVVNVQAEPGQTVIVRVDEEGIVSSHVVMFDYPDEVL